MPVVYSAIGVIGLVIWIAGTLTHNTFNNFQKILPALQVPRSIACEYDHVYQLEAMEMHTSDEDIRAR